MQSEIIACQYGIHTYKSATMNMKLFHDHDTQYDIFLHNVLTVKAVVTGSREIEP